jgi:hypothetical protein
VQSERQLRKLMKVKGKGLWNSLYLYGFQYLELCFFQLPYIVQVNGLVVLLLLRVLALLRRHPPGEILWERGNRVTLQSLKMRCLD